jgi:hypothetical protein
MIETVVPMTTSSTRPYWADFSKRLRELGDTCLTAVAEVVDEVTDLPVAGVVTVGSVTKDSAGVVTVWITSSTTAGVAIVRVSITGASLVPEQYRDDLRMRIYVDV